MAVADGLGHNFEFMDVRDFGFKREKRGPFFEYPCECPGGKVHNPLNQFNLQPGQWTDDCSMGLCMADSLLAKGDYDGTSIRIWFWNWWFNGLDNAFKRDPNRQNSHGGGSLSVGLGGNISKSLMDVLSDPDNVTPRFEVVGEDAGNGSLMRLAPMPIRYHSDLKLAREMAFESSLTTHPGYLAAEACSFYAHAIVRALYRENEAETIVSFLDRVSAEYLTLEGGHESKQVIGRLLRSEEPEGTERCWNWKDTKNGLRIEATLKARGRKYNGYPVSAGYFGAFSIDGLAMSLHCLYTTTSFNEAIAKVINYCGDADTTGAICAQLAGAFYGYAAIDPTWVSWLHPWDNREIELRAIALFLEGEAECKAK
jgi:ADP-ribosyl-[dinitrogen reductase] hydrolase